MLLLVLGKIEFPCIFVSLLSDWQRPATVLPSRSTLQFSDLFALFSNVLVLSFDMLDQLLPGQLLQFLGDQDIALCCGGQTVSWFDHFLETNAGLRDLRVI